MMMPPGGGPRPCKSLDPRLFVGSAVSAVAVHATMRRSGGGRFVPLYEYQCPKCGRFEVIQKFAEAPLAVCPTCRSEVQKLPSAPAIQFKGTGWYVTDYPP